MKAKKDGGRREKLEEVLKLRKLIKEGVGFVIHLHISRRHDGHDGDSCVSKDTSKSPEKEPIMCHIPDHLGYGEEDALEPGRKNRNMRTDWGTCSLVYKV